MSKTNDLSSNNAGVSPQITNKPATDALNNGTVKSAPAKSDQKGPERELVGFPRKLYGSYAEYTNPQIIASALALDAKYYGADKAEYSSKNYFQYYVAIELWAGMFDSFTRNGYRRLVWSIGNRGLVAMLKECDECAQAILRNSSKGLPFLEGVDISKNAIAQLLPPIADTSVLLQLCRFLKRFTPIGALSTYKAACTSFLECQEKMRVWRLTQGIAHFFPMDPTKVKNYGRPILRDCTRPTNPTRFVSDIIERMKAKINSWVPNWSRTEWYTISSRLGDFSNGSSQEGKTLVKKINAFASTYNHIYGVPLIAPAKGVPFDVKQYTVAVKPVPKSWKSPRLIAPEAAVPNWWLTGARKALYRAFPKKDSFDAENQDINRLACYEASLNWDSHHVYVTIDHSSASDSIPYYHARDMFPEGLMSFIDDFRAKEFTLPILGKQRFFLRTFLTSGNPLTFMLEGIFFLALAEVATEITATYYWCIPTDDFLKPLVFGDDVLLDARVFDTYVSIAELIGLTINVDKSFDGKSRVKESCGVEYLCGADTATLYWPRNEITDDLDSLQSLVSLEQRLYRDFPDQATWLTYVVRGITPVTGTEPNPCFFDGTAIPLDRITDLIEPFPIKAYSIAPHKGKLELPERLLDAVKREKHTVFEGKSLDTYSNNVEAYLYAMFLRNGPSYEDSTMRSLNVSQPISRAGTTSPVKQAVGRKER